MGFAQKIAELHEEKSELIAALERLRPASAYLFGLPDSEVVNLVTTVGALRQAEVALSKAKGSMK